jgi:hypothetical protein
MFFAMGSALKSSLQRVHMLLAIGLVAACAANLALVCAWLGD